MSEVTLGVDLKRYPTLARFSNSDSFIRMLIGPAGSLKTTWCFYELLRRACMQQPDKNGVRYTRWVVIRNTFDVLNRATIPTAKRAIPDFLLKYTEGNNPKAAGRFTLGDGTQVDIHIDFLAIDTDDVLGKLLGYDYTGAILDEVSELTEEIVLAAARRAGRFPSSDIAPCTWYGAYGATNGPLKTHWLYAWSLGGTEEMRTIKGVIEKATDREFFKLFQQPPALLRPDATRKEWEENPLAENVHNLPGGYSYYFAMLGGSDQKIAAYVEGKFANLATGKTVFHEFSRERHVVKASKIPALGKTPIIIGADFGRTPVVLIGAEAEDGTLVIMDEICGEDVSIETLLDNEVVPLIQRKYKRSPVHDAWGDPAGSVGGQATEASPFSVCRRKNIPMTAPTSNNQLEGRLDAVRWMLTRVGVTGKPKLRVSDNCPLLIAALAETYIYEAAKGVNRANRELPTKSHVDWVSDLADALGYVCLGIRLRGQKRYITPNKKRKKAGKSI